MARVARQRTGARGPRGQADLVPFAPAAVLQIDAWPDTVAEAAAILGRSLPVPAGPGTFAAEWPATLVHLAPGRHLLVSEKGPPKGLAAALSPAAAVTDLTHGRSGFRLAGRMAGRIANAWGLQNGLDGFPPGAAAQTLAGHFPVLALGRGEGTLDILIAESLALSFRRWLGSG